MTAQAEHLTRVRQRIERHILDFISGRSRFHADELRMPADRSREARFAFPLGEMLVDDRLRPDAVDDSELLEVDEVAGAVGLLLWHGFPR